MGKFVGEVNDKDFEEEVLQSSIPVLVDFWAPWCGPCVSLGPVIEEAAEKFAGKIKVVKVNVSENQKYAASYNVRGIPNLIMFKEGKVVEQRLGALGKDDLHSFMKTHG